MRRTLEIAGSVETFFGTLDENLKYLESAFHVAVELRNDKLFIEGSDEDMDRVAHVLQQYNELVRGGKQFRNGEIKAMLRLALERPSEPVKQLMEPAGGQHKHPGKKVVTPRSANQRAYLDSIEKYDMVFAVGPGGTGKTYLAVAAAVSALLNKRVNRIILARPAVEAGERLGFLPGTLQEKVDPYMRPLYDALYDMLDTDKLERFLEKGVIEVAPLAFMRGRTLNDSFVILDEAQNTTSEQMKMFLTRLGFNSKAVITGDITQIDLPSTRRSGLVEALEVTGKIEGIATVMFNERDVVRHNLVQQIIRAYEEFDATQPKQAAAAAAAPENAKAENAH